MKRLSSIIQTPTTITTAIICYNLGSFRKKNCCLFLSTANSFLNNLLTLFQPMSSLLSKKEYFQKITSWKSCYKVNNVFFKALLLFADRKSICKRWLDCTRTKTFIMQNCWIFISSIIDRSGGQFWCKIVVYIMPKKEGQKGSSIIQTKPDQTRPNQPNRPLLNLQQSLDAITSNPQELCLLVPYRASQERLLKTTSLF